MADTSPTGRPPIDGRALRERDEKGRLAEKVTESRNGCENRPGRSDQMFRAIAERTPEPARNLYRAGVSSLRPSRRGPTTGERRRKAGREGQILTSRTGETLSVRNHVRALERWTKPNGPRTPGVVASSRKRSWSVLSAYGSANRSSGSTRARGSWHSSWMPPFVGSSRDGRRPAALTPEPSREQLRSISFRALRRPSSIRPCESAIVCA
jgi:hypothetical protein